MRLSILLPAFCAIASSASAAAAAESALVAAQHAAQEISAGNCYGAPNPPWKSDAKPGWYYGRPEYAPAGLPCLVDFIGNLLCAVLRLLLGCNLCPSGSPPVPPPPPPPVGSPPPPPPSNYTWGFTNYTCAIEVWPPPYYLTYGICESDEGCAKICDTVPGCVCANAYHDVNASKNTTQLTCALFSVHVTEANATNCGGQQQQPLPNGTTYITNSDLFCKTKPTPSP
ncbi:hypothetical protein B0H11DRAFT_1352477 [Mycena galericulata]|nr:hypothetical protein B0H11DRAFT_1352477 [Mycena galericulata]